MSIQFNTIPLDIRTVGQFIEFDSSRAVRGLPVQQGRILIIGQATVAGAPLNVPQRVFSADQVAQTWGRGSMLHRQTLALFAVSPLFQVWVAAVADNPAGVAATGGLVITAGPTAAGTYSLYIGGQRVQVAMAAGQPPAAIAAALVAAVNADPDLPVTATVVAGNPDTALLTCRWKGATGNSIDLRDHYYVGGDPPPGLATSAPFYMIGGASDPDVTPVFAAMGDMPFSHFVLAYVDAANLAVVEAALTERWGPTKQLDGLAFCAPQGSLGALLTFGLSRNSQFVSALGLQGPPTPIWEVAAAYAGIIAFYGAADPARPFQTLALPGVLAPVVGDRFTREEREQLLHDGVSTATVDDYSGAVLLERPITTSRTNVYGQPDAAYLDVTTMQTLSYLRYQVRTRIATKYPRHKLADDGTNFGPGQAIVTPKILRAEIVALFREMEAAGQVQDLDQFISDLLVERDATNRDQANALIPPNLINGFRVFAAQIQFRL